MRTRAAIERIMVAGRQPQTRQIIQNGSSLVGSVALTSGLGFAYWFVAALLFPPAEIGLAAASISAMALLASLATFGLGTLLVAELHRHAGRESGLIGASMIVAGTVGLVFGMAFALAAGTISRDFAPLSQSPITVALFGTGVALTSAAAVLDIALVGVLRGDLQFSRTAIFAFSKLGFLVAGGAFLLGTQARFTIIGTWIAGLLLSIIIIGLYGSWRGMVGRILPFQFGALRLLRGAALRNHALNLALAVTDWTMPILATIVLSAATSGAFFIAWMIAGVALFVPAALAQALFAVCARAPETLPANLRMTLRLSLVAGVVISVGTIIVGPRLLAFLGHDYLDAAPALILMSLGIFPVAIKAHYVTIGRLEGSLMETTRVATAGAVVELSLAAAGGITAGLTGIGLGVLIGLVLQALVMLPRIRRVLRDGAHAARTDDLPANDPSAL